MAEDEESIEGSEEKVAYYIPQRKVNRVELKQERLTNMIQSKNGDIGAIPSKFNNEKEERDEYKTEQFNHYLLNRKKLIEGSNSLKRNQSHQILLPIQEISRMDRSMISER